MGQIRIGVQMGREQPAKLGSPVGTPHGSKQGFEAAWIPRIDFERNPQMIGGFLDLSIVQQENAETVVSLEVPRICDDHRLQQSAGFAGFAGSDQSLRQHDDRRRYAGRQVNRPAARPLGLAQPTAFEVQAAEQAERGGVVRPVAGNRFEPREILRAWLFECQRLHLVENGKHLLGVQPRLGERECAGVVDGVAQGLQSEPIPSIRHQGALQRQGRVDVVPKEPSQLPVHRGSPHPVLVVGILALERILRQIVELGVGPENQLLIARVDGDKGRPAEFRQSVERFGEDRARPLAAAGEIEPVQAVGRGNSEQRQQGGYEVHLRNAASDVDASAQPASCAHDQRYAEGRVVQEDAVTVLAVITQTLAVIGDHDDQCLFGAPQLVENLQ